MSLSFSLLSHRDFRLLFMARMFVHMAFQATAVIIGWQIWSLTKSAMLLGLVGLVEALPAIGGALFSGYLVDKSTPRTIYILCLSFLSATQIFLWAVGSNFAGLSDPMLVTLLFAGMFLSGTGRSFLMPSYFSILPQIVERKDYSAASAWANTAVQIATMTGPVAAGLAYGFIGVQAAWVLPASFMMLGLLSVTSIRISRPYDRPPMKESALANIVDGWRYIFKNRMILTVMAVDMLAVLFGGAVAMLPAYASDILHVGPEALGLLRTAPSFGALLAALYFAVRPMRTFPLTRLLWAVTGFGLATIGFGLSTSFFLSVFLLALSGLFDSVGVVVRASIKQVLTPDHMRGRVAAINSMFVTSSNEIGAFESGLAASLMGLVPSVVFGGVMSVVVAGATYLATPRLRRQITDENSHISH